MFFPACMFECACNVQAAAVWSLGQLGKHDAEHANALAEQDVLRLVQNALLHEESSDGTLCVCVCVRVRPSFVQCATLFVAV
jgi:hypothetical protein